jgi:undecaprenyl diphosphate synthase
MLDKDNIPRHIALIMDGNGRWAKQRGLPRTAGHKAGIDRVREIIKAASDLGVKVVTLFAFSNENWSRPKSEVSLLMRALNSFLDREIRELMKNNVRLMVIGRDKPIPDYLLKKLAKAKEKTKENTGLIFVLALNYGARQEMVDAIKRYARAAIEGKADPDDLDQEIFSDYLYTAGLPDPDLLVRTSGEMRISNFLLWQLSYAELYFPEKFWPDFGKDDLENAIEVYQKRDRRFGRIGRVDVVQKNN